MKIYLGSKSPRRQELLKLMNIEYELILKDTEESFPSDLPLEQVAAYISEKKAKVFDAITDALIITADTVVVLDNEIIGKPADEDDAFKMLTKLSGRKHRVITAVSILSNDGLYTFSDTTEVSFKILHEDQIWYYILNYKPLDKAGAYGIQEWIGLVGIESINGSYSNVVGLPTEKLHAELLKLKAL